MSESHKTKDYFNCRHLCIGSMILYIFYVLRGAWNQFITSCIIVHAHKLKIKNTENTKELENNLSLSNTLDIFPSSFEAILSIILINHTCQNQTSNIST